MKDCYKIYSSRFSSMMLNVASQAETIRGTANADIKVPNLMLLFGIDHLAPCDVNLTSCSVGVLP